jgi:hypothetical protein
MLRKMEQRILLPRSTLIVEITKDRYDPPNWSDLLYKMTYVLVERKPVHKLGRKYNFAKNDNYYHF